jgi:hypothetical protein
MKKLMIVIVLMLAIVPCANAGHSFLKVSYFTDILDPHDTTDGPDMSSYSYDGGSSGSFGYSNYNIQWWHTEGRIGLNVTGDKLAEALIPGGGTQATGKDRISFGFCGLDGQALQYSVEVIAPESSFEVRKCYWKKVSNGGVALISGGNDSVEYQNYFSYSENVDVMYNVDVDNLIYSIDWDSGSYDMTIRVEFDSAVSDNNLSWGAVKSLYR